MDDETRAYLEEIGRQLTAFAGRFDALDRRFDATDGRLDVMDRRFDTMDRRFDGLDSKIETYRRETGVITENLLDKIQLVGEGLKGTVAAVDRLRADMEGRFNENATLMRAVFRQLRRDITTARTRRR